MITEIVLVVVDHKYIHKKSYVIRFECDGKRRSEFRLLFGCMRDEK